MLILYTYIYIYMYVCIYIYMYKVTQVADIALYVLVIYKTWLRAGNCALPSHRFLFRWGNHHIKWWIFQLCLFTRGKPCSDFDSYKVMPPSDVYWFINRTKYAVDISTINPNYWSYKPTQLSMGHNPPLFLVNLTLW